MQTNFHFSFHRDSTDAVAGRKLTLKKETLRQLTDGELHRVAGGAVSTISVSPSTRQSGTSVVSSGTSVISVSTSANPSGG